MIVWGPPGVGKTATITAEAEAIGYRVVVLVGNCRAPEDFVGLPSIVDGVARYSPQGWAADIAEGEQVLVLLDELTTCTPAVMAAMLRVVQERHVGDLRLPDSVRIIAAANPAGMGGGTRPLSPPLANRFVHADFAFDAAAWSEWMIANHQGSAALGPVLGFLRSRADLLLAGVPLDAASAGGAWPSPRSWDAAVAICATAERSAWLGLIATAVGIGAASEWATWFDRADLPDSRAVLADPSSVTWSKLRPDQTHAILVSCVALAAGDADLRVQAFGLLAAVGEVAPDLGVAALAGLIRACPDAPIPFGSLGAYSDFLSALR